jgi:LacI family transcriptional regulator
MRVPTTNPPSEPPAGIKDIARAVGVSIATVDRALHAKPGVNAATRDHVLRMAAALGYRPNLAARYLKCRVALRISVQLPQQIAPFWDLLREGIREAAAQFAPALHVDFRACRNRGIPLIEKAIGDGTHGLIIAPGNRGAVRQHPHKAARRHIPVVCVVTDAPDSERLTSVTADPFTGGAMAGELLARCVPGGSHAAFFTSCLSVPEHAARLRGFQASLQLAGGALQLGPVVEADNDDRDAYRRAIAVLGAHPDLKALYISSANSLPVLRAADQAGRLPRLVIVTTDLFPELADWIRKGKVSATVYQRPMSQGRLAVQALVAFLLSGTRPPPRLPLVPHLVMRSNLDMFLDRLGVKS